MKESTTYAEKDGYWYRMVWTPPDTITYRWGHKDGYNVWEARVNYLGRGRYILSDRTVNGKKYLATEKFTRRDRRRTHAYNITVTMLKRMVE